ncbi:MAG TPA: hypothetical protein VK681_39205 [Reyranella sp.]|nr:hypothetical protein [Reyranella sp.]
MSVINRLDWEGFVAQAKRLHAAHGWNLEHPASEQRMNVYWDALRFLCTTAELARAVDRCLYDLDHFPTLAELRQSIHDQRRQPPKREPLKGAPIATIAAGPVKPGFLQFVEMRRQIQGKCFALPPDEPGDAREPEPAA